MPCCVMANAVNEKVIPEKAKGKHQAVLYVQSYKHVISPVRISSH